MIVEFFLLALFKGLKSFFANLVAFSLGTSFSSISFLPDPESLSYVFSFLWVISYIFPVSALMPIVFTQLALETFKFVMTIIIRIKSFLPFMGGA